MKKIVLVIIALLFLSGCTVNYNLKIDKDFKIEEELNLTTKKENFEIGYSKPEEGIKEIFNNINSTLTFKMYDYNTSRKSKNISTVFKKEYNSIEELSNSPIIKDVNGKIEKYDYTKNGKVNKVFQIMINYDFFDLINTRKYSSIGVDDFKLNITFPYKVIETNADSSEGNVLTWDMKNLRTSRSFYIEYDENVEVKEKNNTVFIIIASVALIVLIILFIIIFRKKRTRNSDI